MNQSIISTRYAKALMMVGSENQCLDAFKADMDLLGATISENHMFRQVLDNPVVKPSQKRKVMNELLEKRIHPLSLNFINIIIRNRREFLLADVIRDFIFLYERSKGIKRARITSAVGMDSDTQRQMQQQLNALFKADVQMNAVTNPDIIGGFLLRVDDVQYDASLLAGLKRMRKALIV